MSVNAARGTETGAVDEGAVATIRARNQLDLELYDFARDVFGGRLPPRCVVSTRARRLPTLTRIPDALGPRTPPRLRRLVRLLPR